MTGKTNSSGDHDLLIRVDQKLEILIGNFNTFSTAVNAQIGALNAKLEGLDAEKVDRAEVQNINRDFEVRLRRLELWGGIAIGGLTVIQIGIGIFS